MYATYQPTLTAAAAHEHINDLMRTATRSRIAAELSDRKPRTPRRRPLWWIQVTARTATVRTA